MTVREMYHRKLYSNVRNLLRYYFDEKIWDIKTASYDMYLLGNSCSLLSDFDTAEDCYRRLLQSESHAELCKRGMEELRVRRTHAKSAALFCSNERLNQILSRLLPVFDRIKKNIYVFVADDEAAYKQICREEFDQAESAMYPWLGWAAVGLYNSADSHHLIFKRSTLREEVTAALTGLCAHELAHLELTDTKMRKNFQTFAQFSEENQFFNERLTDLYVISKGFAYELFCARRALSQSPLIMSRNEILDYIEKPFRL